MMAVPPHHETSERSYTIAQAAHTLQVHRTTVQRWISSGRLRAYRVGAGTRTVRILERDLEAAIRPAHAQREGVAEVAAKEEHEPARGTILTGVPTRRLTDEEIRRGLGRSLKPAPSVSGSALSRRRTPAFLCGVDPRSARGALGAPVTEAVVLDTSLALKLVLPEEEHADQADAFFQNSLRAGRSLLVPSHLFIEATNALLQRARRGSLNPAPAGAALDNSCGSPCDGSSRPASTSTS